MSVRPPLMKVRRGDILFDYMIGRWESAEGEGMARWYTKGKRRFKLTRPTETCIIVREVAA